MRAGRSPDAIRLIAVTKGVGPEKIVEAVENGLRDFGESRIQAAQKKINDSDMQAGHERLRWHLIGHLQKNKSRAAVGLFDLIHSVDSLELAVLMNRYAEEAGKIQEILIQVKLSDEESKYGIPEEKLPGVLKELSGLRNLRAAGLMTIPPFFEDPERARPYFRHLREIRDNYNKTGFKWKELSMGMSNDFEVAVEEGSTMVRVGTAIFGERKAEVL
ncbi:MAG: YggS family pyridoxal phosphate-dependent enzyme [Nitrospirae bacterium]|nr:YggS family pyridoxal phosphate-dependent enzyme [Nitrospirota bacterium]